MIFDWNNENAHDAMPLAKLVVAAGLDTVSVFNAETALQGAFGGAITLAIQTGVSVDDLKGFLLQLHDDADQAYADLIPYKGDPT